MAQRAHTESKLLEIMDDQREAALQRDHRGSAKMQRVWNEQLKLLKQDKLILESQVEELTEKLGKAREENEQNAQYNNRLKVQELEEEIVRLTQRISTLDQECEAAKAGKAHAEAEFKTSIALLTQKFQVCIYIYIYIYTFPLSLSLSLSLCLTEESIHNV